MNKYAKAFLEGYQNKSLEKEALPDSVNAFINNALDKAFWASIAAPAVVGIGGGTLLGALNDPSKKDLRILQKRLTNKMLKQNLEELSRANELAKEDNEKDDKRREIHI